MYEDELYHHGILGQKWGKKNGPPYPLDAKDHSASEKKAEELIGKQKYKKLKDKTIKILKQIDKELTEYGKRCVNDDLLYNQQLINMQIDQARINNINTQIQFQNFLDTAAMNTFQATQTANFMCMGTF